MNQLPIKHYRIEKEMKKTLEPGSGLVYGFPVEPKIIMKLLDDAEVQRIYKIEGPIRALLDGGVEQFNSLLHEKLPFLPKEIGLHMNWADELEIYPHVCMLGVKYELDKSLAVDLEYMDLALLRESLTPETFLEYILTLGLDSMDRSAELAKKCRHIRVPKYSPLANKLVKRKQKGATPAQLIAEFHLTPQVLWKAYFHYLSVEDYLWLTRLQREFSQISASTPEQVLGAAFVVWK